MNTALAEKSKPKNIQDNPKEFIHDINNVLMSMGGYIDLWRARLKRSNINCKEFDIIETCYMLMSNMVKSFNNKGHKEKTEIINVNGLLKDNIKHFISDNSNISVENNLEKNLWNTKITEHEIIRVIQNIIVNAKQAMPKCGKITVYSKNNLIKSLQTNQGKYIKIIIQDTGYGISKENINKVKTPLFTTKQNGQGIGLSIADSIVKKYNGWLDVESVPNNGTAVCFYLPAE